MASRNRSFHLSGLGSISRDSYEALIIVKEPLFKAEGGSMTTSPPDGPSRDLRERCAHAHYRLRWARDDWRHMAPVHREAYYEVADAILAEIIAAGYVIVRERAIGDALSDAIMEATRQGWDDPDSAIWRRGMAAGHRTLGLAWPGESEVGR